MKKIIPLTIRSLIVLAILPLVYFYLLSLMKNHHSPTLYESWVFIVSAISVILPTLIAFIKWRNVTSMLYVFLVLALSFAYFFDGYPYLPITLFFPLLTDFRTFFIALFIAISLFHFISPNRFTKPLLIMLPVIAFTWIFSQLLYPYVYGVYAQYYFSPDTTGDLTVSLSASLNGMGHHIVISSFGGVLFLLYYLAKYSHELCCRISKKKA